MKVNLGTVEVTDAQRRAIRRWSGKAGLATRAEVRALYRALAEGDLADIYAEGEAEAHEESGEGS